MPFGTDMNTSDLGLKKVKVTGQGGIMLETAL